MTSLDLIRPMNPVDSLHKRVTRAIWEAEHLDKRGADSKDAWAEVSAIEEELARASALAEPEKRIARRGAIEAALKAGDHSRAKTLSQQYEKEAARL